MTNLRCECGSEAFIRLDPTDNITDIYVVGGEYFRCVGCSKRVSLRLQRRGCRVIVNDAGEFIRTEEVEG